MWLPFLLNIIYKGVQIKLGEMVREYSTWELHEMQYLENLDRYYLGYLVIDEKIILRWISASRV